MREISILNGIQNFIEFGLVCTFSTTTASEFQFKNKRNSALNTERTHLTATRTHTHVCGSLHTLVRMYCSKHLLPHQYTQYRLDKHIYTNTNTRTLRTQYVKSHCRAQHSHCPT